MIFCPKCQVAFELLYTRGSNFVKFAGLFFFIDSGFPEKVIRAILYKNNDGQMDIEV